MHPSSICTTAIWPSPTRSSRWATFPGLQGRWFVALLVLLWCRGIAIYCRQFWWFFKELDRLHNKIQRRINRRRSLNRLNCAFGEANPKRAIIIEKCMKSLMKKLRKAILFTDKPLRNGIRRALSDYQIHGMDPRKDVEQEIRPRRAEWLRRNKRVSFTSPSAATVTQPASAREFRDASSMKRDLCSQKSSVSSNGIRS